MSSRMALGNMIEQGRPAHEMLATIADRIAEASHDPLAMRGLADELRASAAAASQAAESDERQAVDRFQQRMQRNQGGPRGMAGATSAEEQADMRKEESDRQMAQREEAGKRGEQLRQQEEESRPRAEANDQRGQPAREEQPAGVETAPAPQPAPPRPDRSADKK
jgi:TolA-binding protein